MRSLSLSHDILSDKIDGILPEDKIILLKKWLDEDWEAADIDRNIILLVRRLISTIDHLNNETSLR